MNVDVIVVAAADGSVAGVDGLLLLLLLRACYLLLLFAGALEVPSSLCDAYLMIDK
jgi:hypothetical protein